MTPKTDEQIHLEVIEQWDQHLLATTLRHMAHERDIEANRNEVVLKLARLRAYNDSIVALCLTGK